MQLPWVSWRTRRPHSKPYALHCPTQMIAHGAFLCDTWGVVPHTWGVTAPLFARSVAGRSLIAPPARAELQSPKHAWLHPVATPWWPRGYPVGEARIPRGYSAATPRPWLLCFFIQSVHILQALMSLTDLLTLRFCVIAGHRRRRGSK